MDERAHPEPGSAAGATGTRGLGEAVFTCETAQEGDRIVVSMQGEIDLAVAPALQRDLLALVDRPAAKITVDLGGVTFLDSSGLGALYRARQAADARGIPLRLESVPDHVMRVLDVTAMTPRFGLGSA
jgi:anti-anti-sigma factor